MPPNLMKSYPKVVDTFRDRERYGAHVYFARLEGGLIALDAEQNPLRFDHSECAPLLEGKSIADVIAARPERYPDAPRKPGRKKISPEAG